MAGRPNTHGGYCLEEVTAHLSCRKEVIGGILQEVRRVDTWMRTGMSGAQLPIPAAKQDEFHWDVEHPGGAHSNVRPDGEIHHGNDNFP